MLDKFHLTAGDALAADLKQTGIGGELLVCRECFVDGPLAAADFEEFWTLRAAFVEKSFGERPEEYRRKVVGEFGVLGTAAACDCEINLWFEYELFCRVNYWFCLDLLRGARAKVFVVAPTVLTPDERWQGFGGMNAESLEKCFANRRALTAAEIRAGGDLWRAFRTDDFEALENISESAADGLPYLGEVLAAAVDRKQRVPQILREIESAGAADFAGIFDAFRTRAGVYGYGDAQIRGILDTM